MNKVFLSLFLGYFSSTTIATEPTINEQGTESSDVFLNVNFSDSSENQLEPTEYLTEADFQTPDQTDNQEIEVSSEELTKSDEPICHDMRACIEFPGFMVEILVPAEATGNRLSELLSSIENAQQSADEAWRKYFEEKQRIREIFESIINGGKRDSES